jgi:hypothetical protein
MMPRQAAARVRPPADTREQEMGVEVSGLLGLVILVANVYAIVKIVQSAASTGAKVLWIVVILLLPVIGLIIWFLAGPKG